MKNSKKQPVKLARIIRKVQDLPTLPRTVLKITELVNNPKSSAKDLAVVITEDQVLTARLLKLVNSAFYGFPQKISTVTGAVVLLGFDAIRTLLLTTSVFDLFSNRNKKHKDRYENFWDHSLGCAVGAKIVGNHIRYDKVEELFVSGLLHDIGKIVEVIYMPEEFSNIVSMVEEKNILMVEAEKQILGCTHADVGKLIAEKWNLPPKLINAIAHHHEPDLADNFLLETGIVHTADIFFRAMYTGSGGDNKIPSLNQKAWAALKLDQNMIEPIMEEIEQEFNDIRFFVADMR